MTRSRILTVLRWVGIGLLGLATTVALGLVAVMTLPAAARWVIHAGLDRAPADVQVATVAGPLRGPLVLEGVHFEQDGLEVRAERVVVDWRPLALLSRRVEIDSLHVEGVTAFVPGALLEASEAAEAPPERSGPPAVPELPVELVVGALRLEAGSVQVEGRGEVRSLDLELSGTLDAFEAAMRLRAAAERVDDIEVQARLAGSPDAYRLELDAGVASADLPPASASLEARGSLTTLTVDTASVETEHGSAGLVAEVAWYPEVTWRVAAVADLLDVAPLTPDPRAWPGSVSFRAHSEGRLAESGVEASARVEDLSGTLRGEPLSGSLDARVRMPTVEVEDLDLRWGELEARASGSVVETADLGFLLSVPDLGQLRPGAAGSVRVEGELHGTRDRPRMLASIDGRGLRLDSLAVGIVAGDLELDLQREAPNRIDVRAEAISTGDTSIDSAAVRLLGTRDEHELHAGAWMPTAGLTLSGSGALTLIEGAAVPSAWSGSLDSLALDADRVGTWRLARPSAVFASADSASLSELCVGQGQTAVCVTGDRSSEGTLSGDARVVALPLSVLPMSLPEGVSVGGRLDAAAAFMLEADGRLRTEGGLTVDGTVDAAVDTDTLRWTFGGEGARVVVDEDGGRAELALSLLAQEGAGRFDVQANGEAPGFTSIADPIDAQALSGSLRVRSEDLSFLGALVPMVDSLGGRFSLEAGASGTVGAPALRGRMQLLEGQLHLPAAGLRLREIEATAEADEEGGITLSGGARSGEGFVRLEGRSALEPSPEEPTVLRVTGERFRAVGTPEIRVDVEPDLEVRYDGALVTVRGSVSVPWARVELLEIPPAAVAPSEDVVIVDEEPVAPPEVDALVQIVVGDDVRFSGFGFTSMIEGDLRVREEPGTPPSVLGELRFVGGRYRAYGQDLVIDPGRITFAGAAEDATLDVMALRTAQDGTVAGLEVRGSAVAPEVTLTSDPAMADADVLSYILYGKPMSDGNASEQGQVAGAAATLGANVLTTRLASQVGLDEARIEGTRRDQAEFVAGKYLTPSVYVSYGVGLFKPSNTFRIKYLLSSNWALQAESGDANGGDILYQIERGR